MMLARSFIGVSALAAITVACVLTAPAYAQWLVTNLHPVGAVNSYANAAIGGQQVGNIEVGGLSRASLWTGRAASWVDLQAYLPADFTNSLATGISSGT